MNLPAPAAAITALVVAFLGMGVYSKLTIDGLKKDKDLLTEQLSTETTRADRNAEEVTRLVDINTANEALASEVRSLRSTLDRRANAIIETITNAPPEADGPVAPVLRDALNSLRDTASTD